MDLTSADRTAIRQIVKAQLVAFQADAEIEAFSFASPAIQSLFRTAGNFMQMVKTSYAAVYRPRSVIFEELGILRDIPTQPVLLMDLEGDLKRAIYLMEKQPDGEWKINGCYLVAVEDT